MTGADNMPWPLEPRLDMDDIQGIAVPGFLKPHQILLGIRYQRKEADIAGLRSLLAKMTPDISTAAHTLRDRREHRQLAKSLSRKSSTKKSFNENPTKIFQPLVAVGFSYQGLFDLTVGAALIPSLAYKNGMVTRSALLGDSPVPGMPGNPTTWSAGKPGEEFDILVVVAGDDRKSVRSRADKIVKDFVATGAKVNKQVGDIRDDIEGQVGHEHFGFDDGVSQPGIRGRASDAEDDFINEAKPLKNRARVHFHAFTSETIAEVALRGVTELKPGNSAFAQLRTAEPLLLLPGDRAILRQFSPVITIGGAVVLDAFPMPRQKQDAVQRFLQTLSSGNRQETLLARIARRGHEGLSLAASVRETGLKQSVLQPMIAALIQQKQIIQVGEFLLSSDAMQKTREKLLASLETFHKANPLVGGIGKEELREKMGLHQTVMEAMLAQLTRDKKAEVAGEQVRLAGRGVELKGEEAKAKEQIEKAFADAGLKVPLMKEVLENLPVDKTRAQKLVTLLLRDRVLIKLADDLVFHQTALLTLRQLMATQKAKTPKIDVATFKDLLGVTRKYAIPLLEYLDQQRVTRRVGDERIIL